MSGLETVIEKKLIDQLCCDDLQWTYRPDIRTEDQLWNNFKYILEQNNKAVLNGTPLSESEFSKIKNDVSHASFYDAGKWLIGESGKVYVHIQRGNEALHLVVLNNEHVVGGTSVYEVINQYRAFKSQDMEGSRNRRFDVTLLINGIPMIHIELKNKEHSYMDAYRQIKKYIAEGKFRGLFSNVQMFVVSNAVDTKYFSAAKDTELKHQFITGWLDKENQPVCDYIEFAKEVLKIPMAHEMVTKYTVLDNDKRKLLILRPYQIHAIRAMRAASKRGESGYIWHTTGSGKTMTSYKATRNLLMDIPSIEKTVFLIDRKDLDRQTGLDFKSYAQNDTIDVDDTEYVDSLIKKMKDGKRQMIVTTRQKMQIMVNRRLKEGSSEYDKIKSLKVAFVVDECHRALMPQAKRELEKFFTNSLWYGFTGTPIFEENSYEKKGDLPRTTKQLYGECLHNYTIKEAIHDKAVLEFMVENLGAKDLSAEDAEKTYNSETHMRKVLDIILNQSYSKFGINLGRGKTFEAILTTSSIPKAQKYYDLLKRVKEGKDELKICDSVHKALPDFPKFAITYSLSENQESSMVNQAKMKESLEDYKEMFGCSYKIEEIGAYNNNLNERLARKGTKYRDRSQQLDLVIVVDRLLTGFDAPCLSTLYMDRKPMSPQNIIQAFSRTNRLFDDYKQYGHIVTFQAPNEYKAAINNAIRMYSRNGEGNPIAEDWDDVKTSFFISLKEIRNLARSSKDIAGLSRKQKKLYVKLFRALDHDFAHLKSFTVYKPKMLDEFGFSEEEYENYAAMYKNVMEELRQPDDNPGAEEDPIWDDYDLVAYSKLKIDYEYIVELLREFQEFMNSSKNEAKKVARLEEIKEIIAVFAGDNPKLSALLSRAVEEIEKDRNILFEQDIYDFINEKRSSAIDDEIRKFALKWYLKFEDVRYEAFHFRNGELANENKLKDSADYAAYRQEHQDALSKPKFRRLMIEEFKDGLMPEIAPLM